MSDIPTGDPGKPMEQPINDLPDAIKQTSMATSRISSSSKNLSDMPIHVAGLIIERSDYKEQLILRKTSKSLRALVDKQKPACKSVEVNCCMEFVYITFNNQRVMYKNLENEFKPHNFTGKIVKRDDFMKVAFDDLASTLKNPKLQLEEFIVHNERQDLEEKYCKEIRNVLESLSHQVSVRKIKSYASSPSCLLSILPFLKPGFLEIISLDPKDADWRGNATEKKIARLERWKQAKQLELWNFFDSFPLKYATHFKRFLIDERFIYGSKFIRIRDYLSKLENFEYCRIRHIEHPSWKDNIELVQEMIGTPVPPNMSHYSIPDSDYCLEFSFALNRITIVKKICHFH